MGNTIQAYIDLDIVNFITDLTETKSFSDINGMIKLLEVERSRLLQNREVISKEFANTETNTKEFDNLFTRFVGSFVLEQKIIDRRDVAKHIMDMKGAVNTRAPKPNATSKPLGDKKITPKADSTSIPN